VPAPAAEPVPEPSGALAPLPVAAPEAVRPAENLEHDGDEPEEDEDEDDLDRARRAAEREQRNAPPPEPIRFMDVISGQFDADENNPEAPPLKRVLLPEADSPKLHKVLAQAGLGSRMEMEQLILQGRISVNNEPAHIGQRIQYGDQIKLNGKPIRFRIAPPPARVIAYHKPVGEVVTHDDPRNRPTVFRKLPRLHQGKWQSVGRLDLNTEGLLLFTNSGELANRLMHPRFGLEREYAVRVLGALSNEERQRLLDGVRLDDGMAQFGGIEEGGGEGSNCWYRVTISEGRNREVRRLFESVGHAVSRLIRIRYGAMALPRGLRRGAWMELDERDIGALIQAAGGAIERAGRTGGKGARGGQGGKDKARDGGARGVFGRNKRRNDNRDGQRGGGRGEREEIPDPLAHGPSARGGKGPSQGRRGQGRGPGEDRAPGGGGQQPDPMKTSLGYIGADSFSRQRKEQRQQGPRRGGGPPGGNFGGQGGGGRRRGR
jgi:23S rRNA pseudouridine2605 synthase